MALFLTEAEVASLLPMDVAVEALEDAFLRMHRGGASNRPRARVRTDGSMLHVMSASIADLGVMGYKAYAASRGGAIFHFHLYDGQGTLLAVMQADRMGQIRTGAASGVATRYMAAEDAGDVALIGAGWQAVSQLQAVHAVRSIRSVRVYARTADRLQEFCTKISADLGLEVEPVADGRSAVQGADIVITATNAREPVLLGEWLKEGAHVNAIGSNAAQRQEVDAAVIQRSRPIVIDSITQGKIEAGDLLVPIQEGLLSWSDVRELSAVVAGEVAGRERAEDITFFESLGIAVEDVAVGQRVYNAAREAGIGREIEL